MRPATAPPPVLHAQAMDNLRLIRRTMEDSSAFTALPGWGQVIMSLTAIAAAALAARESEPSRWLAVWMLEACAAASIGVATMVWKARAAGVPLLSGPARRFALGFGLPVAAAAMLTLVLARAGEIAVLPGLWLLRYGTAIVCGSMFSVRIVPLLGGCFVACGVVGLLLPVPRDLLLAGAFGGLHLVFGILIARRHGG